MATRIQSLALGLGSAKQSDISTISSSFVRWRKIDAEIPTLIYGTETDKDEIGKGNEFISQVFPTAYDVSGRIEKFGSAEFTAWAWGYALGNVALATGLYTIKPIDPATTIELPYFSIVNQLPEGGGFAVNEALLGNCIDEVTTEFRYGPGRASLRTTCTYLGSGRHTIPSGVTLPASPLTEAYMLSSSAAITINGIDYVAGSPGAKTILMGSMSWRNNIIAGMRYFPGSGLVDNAAVGGRIFIGPRTPLLSFTAFLQADSTEYAKLIAQTTGTAVLTFTFDATHFVTWTFPKISYEAVVRGQEEGLAIVSVTVAPKFDTVTNTVLTVTSKNAITDICQ